MRNFVRRYSKLLFVSLVFGGLLALPWVAEEVLGPGTAQAKITEGDALPQGAYVPLDPAHPQVRAAMAVQDQYTPSLMAAPDVVGTATGLTAEGQPAILVFARRQVIPGSLPAALDGVPVVVQVTGEFVSMKPPAGGTTTVNPKSRFARPVPIGVSTGNIGECSAGTIGARVTDGGNVYALSNNHVYALENLALPGSLVLQPGRYDTGCAADTNDEIGTLASFVSIVFSTSASNIVDAAIALSSTGQLGNATPTGGYGTPNSTTTPAALNAAVQKYGRTTKLTKGTITGIHATVNVGYGSSGTARFVEQIIVSAGKPFIKAGDSGSLLVTDPGLNPVGLLFAGTSSGTAIANPIAAVLSSFSVTIDGQP